MTDAQLRQRLLKVRRTVEEAAAEALKSAEIDETVIAVASSSASTGSAQANINSQKIGASSSASASASAQASASGYNEENAHPNLDDDNDKDDEYEAYEKERASSSAAFQLGMTLFGDDVSAIERTVIDTLGQVEDELQTLMGDIRRSSGATPSSSAGGVGNNLDRIAEEDGDGNGDGDVIMNMDEEAMEMQARALTAKAAFLKKCSAARMYLDQEERMALELLSAPSSSSITAAAADADAAADAPIAGSGIASTINITGSSLVESAKLLSRAERAVEEAESGLEMAERATTATSAADGDSGSSSSSSNTPGTSKAAAADLEAARRIAASLRAQVRRRRSDLKHRAAAAVDRSVSITRDGITVGAGDGGAFTKKGTTTGSSIKTKSHDSLADAYDALSLLSAGQGLDDAIRLIYSNLYELVLEPLIADHVLSFENGAGPPPTVKLHKSESRGVAAGGVGAGSRGMIYKLDWSKERASSGGAASDTTDPIATWSHVLDVMSSVLKFVKTHILLDRSDLCHMLGGHLFGKNEPSSPPASSINATASALLKAPSISSAQEASPLLDKMVRAMWDTCLPASSSLDVLTGLPDMADSISNRTASFEADLIDMELLLQDTPMVGGSAALSPLSVFASNYESRFGEKRRIFILSKGRDILLKGDYHNTTTVGADVKPDQADSPLEFDETDDGMSVFALHKCSVSQVASNLMALCRQTMDDAVDPRSCAPSAANAALPPQLYRTARELLDLYRAIVPSAYGSEIASVPRTAAILHNDCVFFAHNCLTLGLEYKEKFPANTPRLRQLCTFVDLVPPFRELAERAMGSMIDRQKAQLYEVVGSRISILGDALRANESVVEWTDAETALTAGTYHLRHISQAAWRPVLSRDIYGRAMGNLVDTIFSLFLDQVMNAHDISEPASHYVGALFRNTTRTMVELFVDEGRSASGSSFTSRPSSYTDSAALKTARSSCNYWEKFTAVGEFMYMSLSDITAALGEGTFRSVSGPELSKLIVAAFDDSQKRTDLLRLLSPSENAV